MSLHKARPNKGNPDPTQPTSTVMSNGRQAVPHAEIDGKPILGGLQNAIVEGTSRTSEEEKNNVQEYHKIRENTKKVQADTFDKKTGVPKTVVVELKPDPVRDGGPNANTPAPAAEIKKNAEAEKKVDNTIEKKPDAKPVSLETPKVEEKK